MQYYSTNRQSPVAGFRDATLLGQAPDKGLYFPETIPVIDKLLLDNIDELTHEEIAFQVIRPYVGDAIPEAKLRQIVAETVNFDIPLVKVSDEIYSLELFHGPTLAFKDIGARFMSRCLGYFVEHSKSSKPVTVLVATSGDTGGAVANGFYGVEGVEVVILYPAGKVSEVQEKQLTTLGRNVHALEIEGNFDDCQRMVKEAFADSDLTSRKFLTSANSINVARWLPQQFYYFFAWRHWKQREQPPVICVPSGNFGNICAGILAAKSGLPVKHFIAACNVNDIISGYLQGGVLSPKQAVATLSNAMDVGNPSNFVRILEIFHHQFPDLKEELSAATVTDQQTAETIARVYREYQYTLDPHGAVGYKALHDYLSTHAGDKGIFLETAHPVKFPDAVEQNTGKKIIIPQAVRSIMDQPKQSTPMRPLYSEFRAWLDSRTY